MGTYINGRPFISTDMIYPKPQVLYTIARQHDSMEFLCSRQHNSLLWTLPNNEIIRFNESDDFEEKKIDFQDTTIVVTKVDFILYPYKFKFSTDW